MVALSSFAARPASASCTAPMSCVCDTWPDGHVIHGRLLQTDDGRSEVEVIDAITTDASEPVYPGDVIQGESDSIACGVPAGELVAGDEVLAVWQGWPPSSDVAARLVLVAWGPELDLGESGRLAATEAAVLGDPVQCLERFPRPPPKPCKDVILHAVDDGCSVAGPGQRSDGVPFALLLLLAWLPLRIRRRRSESRDSDGL